MFCFLLFLVSCFTVCAVHALGEEIIPNQWDIISLSPRLFDVTFPFQEFFPEFNLSGYEKFGVSRFEDRLYMYGGDLNVGTDVMDVNLEYKIDGNNSMWKFWSEHTSPLPRLNPFSNLSTVPTGIYDSTVNPGALVFPSIAHSSVTRTLFLFGGENVFRRPFLDIPLCNGILWEFNYTISQWRVLQLTSNTSEGSIPPSTYAMFVENQLNAD